ncbi:zinc finger CCHC domain-containing protein 10 [Diorhabda carinulata]|uniref:zinc finger CCHC domain-containing protein 10 n=1 Tax=Diorhabda sublineata TaxID=1163346 RepID=UPI0024E1470B|nr:zinc finger CCHC domain-containing protein 10 [Diorhabda sublineata]XP_057657687.1 zinc finger CCHC domain-containing protein 10 [Diorhabda carinulata]
MTLGKRKAPEYPPQGIRCQKCLEYGHWSYECKGKRKYVHRSSRTQILKKRIKTMNDLTTTNTKNGMKKTTKDTSKKDESSSSGSDGSSSDSDSCSSSDSDSSSSSDSSKSTSSDSSHGSSS